jgi:hypothetical protein
VPRVRGEGDVTKARQRERKKRRQADQQAGPERASPREPVENERATNEAMIKILDVLFRDLAEKAAARDNISIEDALDGSWTLFEAGFLRLVTDDDEHVGIEPCDNRAEQRAQARRNKPLVELRRRLLAETEGDPSAEP